MTIDLLTIDLPTSPIHNSLKMMQQDLLDGQVLLIDKPLEWTSFQVIGKLRWIFKIKKIGHAGTLDPLASGLLIVCTGKFTKKINEYMGMEKEYTGTITLGAITPTYDKESEPTDHKPFQHLTPDQLQAATLPFIGAIQQLPPIYSAIKKNGQRLYDLARRGEEVIVEPRSVVISSFEITGIDLPHVHFKVVCGTGTYIRSLAFDYGKELGVGGYLSKLVRTRIGHLNLQDAKTPMEIEQNWQKPVVANASVADVENIDCVE